MIEEENGLSETLFKKVDYTLNKLLLDIEQGDIGLPDIQRPFVWKNSKIRDLFDSMYKGFPVGYLLFWENDSLGNVKQIGTDGKQHKIPRLVIIDGQQRLTSLYSVLKGKEVVDSDYKKKRIQIAFRPRDSRFAVADAAIRKDPEYIVDITEVWAPGGSSYSYVEAFLSKLAQHKDFDAEEKRVVSTAIDRLYDIQNYPFTAMEISSIVDEEQVSDIFVRINSAGVTLKQADFILTLMSVFWDEGRRALEEFAYTSRFPSETGKASPYNHFIWPDPDQMLRVAVAVGFRRGRLKNTYNLLRGKDLRTGLTSENKRKSQFRILQEAQEKVLDVTLWHEFLKCLVTAGYRDDTMLSSETSLLYAYALFLIGYHDHGVEKNVLRRIIARWFFMSTVTSRYAYSPEGAFENDLNQLPKNNNPDGYIQTLEKIMGDELAEDFWNIRLVNDLETSSSLSPSMFAYYAALNLLNAPVLFSDLKVNELYDPALATKRKNLEKHHLFPKGYLKGLGISETRDINQVANLTYLEWGDNSDVSDKPPAHYMPIMQKRFKDDSAGWDTMMKMHALPKGWYEMLYDDFLKARRKLMADVIRKGYKKLK